jgi:hypothetical protein
LFPELQARFVPGCHTVAAFDENPQAAEGRVIRSVKPDEFLPHHVDQRSILDFPEQPSGNGSIYSKCKPRAEAGLHPATTSLSRLPIASQNLSGLEMNEMDSGTSEASHRFVIMIVIRYRFDAMLHALVGYRAGKEYVFHSVLIMRPCGPARLTEAIMVRFSEKQTMDGLMTVLRVST